ncbi:universal stress protein 1 [Halosimplex carlsbadense 2-9-1]|uniref:Universal stress protein 1 n=1 Tax=Halosimplex carlsbadense 2-9-1 TaxID=797114 RepID=M0CIT4_9EURY|nr:universal stress protein [Halosimplex carlsbadense]ELZ23200.1 universal stress protein 1 [Halosimplex carlsbadense 2-9-1]
MYDDILFPTDGSDAAESALTVAIAAADADDATLHVLYVADTNQPSLANVRGQVTDVLEGEGRDIVEEAAARARNAGVETVDEVVQGGPSRTICDYVDERGIDLVVMGTRGNRDIERIILGSATERVVRNSAAPVLVVPPESDREYPPGSVLVGTDGSEGSEAAVDEGLAVAEAAGATLHLVSVLESNVLGIDIGDSQISEARERREVEVFAPVGERADDRGVAVETAVEEGDVVDRLNEYVATNDIDLVVVGTHGRTGIDKRILGSVTENLMRSASVPVLSVRASEE